MEVGIHEGRGDQLPGHVDDLTGRGRQPRLHGHDATIADADVDAARPSGRAHWRRIRSNTASLLAA
jgi:hypothetical protein